MKDSDTTDDTSRGFIANGDGKYSAKVIRFDVFNSAAAQQSGVGVTFGYMALCDDDALTNAIKFDTSVDTLTFYDGEKSTYNTSTGEKITE